MAMRPIRGYSADNRYPATEHQLRHIYRNRAANGLAPAFAKVGGRVLFDPDRMDALMSERGERTQAA
jgi:hypothetical protein